MLKFQNREFKIMQVADVQETREPNPDTIKLIEAALEKEKPDLVVFTGDQIQGYSATFLKDTEKAVRECISAFLNPLVKRNIPFAVTFGNHDEQGGFSKKEQMAIYESFPGFVEITERNGNDVGTYCIKIKDSENKKDVMAVYIIDSNAKEKDGSYSPVKPLQIDWYKSTREKIKKETGNYLPSIAFQHIPVPEFYEIIEKVRPFKKGSVEDFKNNKHCFYALKKHMADRGDFMGETPAVPLKNTGEFAAFKEKGEVFALFVGHDHNNSFYDTYDGITLGYTQGAGFNTYGPGEKRGVRIFKFNEDNPKNFETYSVEMKDLCSFKPHSPVKHFILSNFPSSVKEFKAQAFRGLAVAAALATTIKVIKEKS